MIKDKDPVQMRRDQLAGVIGNIHSMLAGDGLVTNKLPEHLFVSNFLPYFCGEADIATSKDSFFAYWIAIAGAPGRRVDVIDDTGAVIFTVPRIFNSSFINPSPDGRGAGILAIVNDSVKHGVAYSPSAGSAVMEKGFNKITADIDTRLARDKTDEEVWTDILVRYGKIAAKPKSTSAANDGSDDTQDYDFLNA